MAALEWDKTGKRFYETGVSKGVLYVEDTETPGEYQNGVAWNGLVTVSESPEGGEPSPIYADDIKYLNLMSAEDYNFSIEAYQSPEEFDVCDGSVAPTGTLGLLITGQKRQRFGFSYVNKIGNDVNDEAGYKIHIVYGCVATPADRDHNTINDSPEAETITWDVSTTPVAVTGYKPTAHLIIDSRKFTTETEKAKLTALEATLYGSANAEPTLPSPDEIILALK